MRLIATLQNMAYNQRENEEHNHIAVIPEDNLSQEDSHITDGSVDSDEPLLTLLSDHTNANNRSNGLNLMLDNHHNLQNTNFNALLQLQQVINNIVERQDPMNEPDGLIDGEENENLISVSTEPVYSDVHISLNTIENNSSLSDSIDRDYERLSVRESQVETQWGTM